MTVKDIYEAYREYRENCFPTPKEMKVERRYKIKYIGKKVKAK